MLEHEQQHNIMNFTHFPSSLMAGDFLDFSHVQGFLMSILWIVVMFKHLFFVFNHQNKKSREADTGKKWQTLKD